MRSWLLQWTIVTIACLQLFITPIYALPSDYNTVTQKIHYTDPNRTSGGQSFEATKKIGAKNPILKFHIFADPTNNYTKKFFDDSYHPLINTYPDIQFIYHHRTFLDLDKSIEAALIGECVADQNVFWENLPHILKNSENLGNLDYLQGVDITTLKTCISNPNTKQVIKIVDEDAKNAGINGIPSFIIEKANNDPDVFDILVNGAQSFEVFQVAIDETRGIDPKDAEIRRLQEENSKLEYQNLPPATPYPTATPIPFLTRTRYYIDYQISRLLYPIQTFFQEPENYIEEENLGEYTLIPITWKPSLSPINYDEFISEQDMQKSYQENPLSGGIYQYTARNQVYANGKIHYGVWVDRKPIEDITQRGYALFWPPNVGSTPTILSTLTYLDVHPCTTLETGPYCAIGLDEHFRKQTSSSKNGFIRWLKFKMGKNPVEYKETSTYLSIYKIPHQKRFVLSNPCPDKTITAFTGNGYDEKNLNLRILCQNGTTQEGTIIFPN